MTTVGIKICKRAHVSFLSVPSMNFTFQKNYAAQTLCSHSIIQSSPTPYSSTTYKSTLYLVSLGNLAHFYLVIWHTKTIIPPYIAPPTLRQKIHLSWKFQIVLPSFLFVAFFAIIHIILFPQMLIKGFPNVPKNLPQLVL